MIIDGRPFNIYLIGDISNASQWIAWSRNKVIQNDKLKGKVWRQTYYPTPKIKITLNSITANSGSIIIEVSTILVDSGRTVLAYTTKLLTLDDELTYLHKRKDNTLQTEIEKDQLGKTVGKNLVVIEKPIPPLSIEEKSILAFTDANDLLYKHSTMFSGLMREVVQTHIGMGKKIYYSPSWDKTHGIIKTLNKKIWIIEISRDKGVLVKNAKTLSFTAGGKESILSDLKEHSKIKAILEPEKDLNFMSEAKVLLTPLEMDVFYSKQAYFAGCGWAFSYDTLEAQNTCFELDELEYTVGYRYKIIFITDSKGDIVAANLLEIESGYLWGDTVQSPKVPNYGSMLLESVDWNNRAASNPAPSNDMSFYVFYDGPQEIICRHTNESIKSPSTFDWPSAVSTVGDGVQGIDLTNPTFRFNYLSPGDFLSGSGFTYNNEKNYIDSVGIYFNSPVNLMASGNTVFLKVSSPESPTDLAYNSGGSVVVGSNSGKMEYHLALGGNNTYHGDHNTIVIPFFDRESAYSYSSFFINTAAGAAGITNALYEFVYGDLSTQSFDTIKGKYKVIAVSPEWEDQMSVAGLASLQFSTAIDEYTSGPAIPSIPYSSDVSPAGTVVYSGNREAKLVYYGSLIGQREIIVEDVIMSNMYFINNYNLESLSFEPYMASCRDAFTGKGMTANNINMHNQELDVGPYPKEFYITRDQYIGIPYKLGK